MSDDIPDEIKRIARAVAAEAARRAADVCLANNEPIAYAGIDVDQTPVGVVLVVMDAHASARLIEFAATLGATAVPSVEGKSGIDGTVKLLR